MRRFASSVLTLAGAALLMTAADRAAAYTPKWLECDGQSVTAGTSGGKPVNETKPVHDTYVYDDDGKYFYKYQENTNRTAIEPTTQYTADVIKWGITQFPGQSGPNWTGELNRSTLALKLNYRDGTETIDFTEQCKPGAPHPGAE
jgi:hypothetical protein